MLANGQNTIKFNFIKRKSGGLTCLCVLPSSHKPRPSVFHIFCKGYMMFNDPNYTQIPNNLFDEHMRDMTGAEFKVMAVICRKTFGWQKKKDKISISQLKTLTGIGRSQIVESLKILEHKTHIKLHKKMVAWLISNPAKRPKKNYARFVNGWLSRAKAEPIKEQYIDLREFKREQGAL